MAEMLHSDPQIRKAAVEKLSQTKTRQPCGQNRLCGICGWCVALDVSKRLKHPKSYVREAAVETLGKMGDAALFHGDQVVARIKDEDRYVRWAAVESLGLLGSAAYNSAGLIVVCLEDPLMDIREAAAEALGRLGEFAKHYVGSVTALLDGSMDPDVRRVAAEALGKMGLTAAEAVPCLSEHIKDQFPHVRVSSLKALAALGESGVSVGTHCEKVVRCIEDQCFSVREAAAEALKSFGPCAGPFVPQIASYLEHTRQEVRRCAVECLVNISDHADEHCQSIIARLDHSDPDVRWCALDAITKMGRGTGMTMIDLKTSSSDIYDRKKSLRSTPVRRSMSPVRQRGLALHS
eukprot:CAMPEP_0204353478 /NCGR_PEP_ID=MMETSP0469-20131031/32691_1 /ASSEMBLY_ACC=CAM_ASM_000384 /TAXON_ID=2969 /ORGANISM="Oxyrrhis marina" /LENGTH=348 /DNA_ID=CAMNT_0051340395 /DNA_START=25 /DNA_END=1071 /DNA_ORIENTATION=-